MRNGIKLRFDRNKSTYQNRNKLNRVLEIMLRDDGDSDLSWWTLLKKARAAMFRLCLD